MKNNLFVVELDMKKNFCFLIMFFVCTTLFGAEFNVTNIDELKSALAISQTNNEADTINLSAVFYKLDMPLVYSPDSTQDNSDLTIRGDDKNRTVLSGSKKAQILKFNLKSGNYANLQIKNVTFENGNVKDDNGGGVSIEGLKVHANIEDCIFEENAGGFGAGFYAEIDTGSVNLKNSYFKTNIAKYQGGGSYIYLRYGNILVSGNIYSKNEAGSLGGGLYAMANYGNVVLTNNTIAQNKSAFGSGAYTGIAQEQDRLYLYNNIIWNNRNKDNQLAGNELIVNNYIYSNSTDTKNVTLKNNAFTNTQSSPVLNISDATKMFYADNTLNNPIFRDYLHDDYRLMPTSTLIDAGDNSALGVTESDITGNLRKINPNSNDEAKIDIGAVEFLYSVDVNKFYDYSGIVQTDSCGIDCGDDCQGIYKKNYTVKLTVLDTPFEDFSYWGGDCGMCYQERSCVITVNDIKTCGAYFVKKVPVNKRGLSVSVEDFCLEESAGGKVLVGNSEICTDNCLYIKENEDKVTLLAVADEGYSFAGWESESSNVNCRINDNCTFNIDENVQIKAIFAKNITFPFGQSIYSESLSQKGVATCLEPIGFGKVSACEDKIDLNIKIPKFDIAVDAYLGFYASVLDDDIYLIDKNGDLSSFSGVLGGGNKFQDNLSDPVFTYPLKKWYPSQDGIKVPQGVYDFYMLITPQGAEDLSKGYYLYKKSVSF